MTAIALSLLLTEIVCQLSYPSNSEKARPPGTFSVYLSRSATDSAAAANAASGNASSTPTNRRLLVITAPWLQLRRIDSTRRQRVEAIGPRYRLKKDSPLSIPRYQRNRRSNGASSARDRGDERMNH